MLDPGGRREVMETVERLHRESGLTVVLVTHFMDEALRAKVREKAEHDLDAPVYLVERVDPAIIGGIMLEVRGKRYDASVRAQLANIRKTLSSSFIGGEEK